MTLNFEHDWSTYGLPMRVSVGVGLVRVSADVWVDSWKKSSPCQQGEPKAVACSVELEDPWVGWICLSRQMEVESQA